VVGIGLSTYLFARKGLRLRALTALFAALAFAFGAPITMRWKHLPLLSVVALFPLEMLLVKRLFQSLNSPGPGPGREGPGPFPSGSFRFPNLEGFSSGGLGFVVGMGAILGLQLFAGHPQMVFYCLVVTGLYFAFNLGGTLFSRERLRREDEPLITNREISLFLRYVGVFALASLLGLGIGAVQLLPTFELLGQSGRSSGLGYAGSQTFPFFFKHLATLLVPFSFGDPSKWAPYLEFNPKVLVWEICAYSGLLAAVFGVLGIFTRSSQRPNSPSPSGFFTFLLIFSALEARFNFLYFLPLAASFRVPARFVVFISFSVSLLAAFFLDEFIFRQVLPKWRLLRKPPVVTRAPQAALLLLVFFSAADLYLHFGKYNQTVAVKDWQQTPPTVSFLQNNLDRDFRMLPLRESYLAFSTYLKQRGWREDPRAFLDGQRLIPYSRGLVWDIPSASIYTGIGVSRTERFLSFVHGGFGWNAEKEALTTAPGYYRSRSS